MEGHLLGLAGRFGLIKYVLPSGRAGGPRRGLNHEGERRRAQRAWRRGLMEGFLVGSHDIVSGERSRLCVHKARRRWVFCHLHRLLFPPWLT